MSALSRFQIASVLALGVAFSSSLAYAHDVKAGDIAVVNAWSRATPAKAGGVFVTLRNDGADADKLIGASSTVAKMVSIHESIKKGGVMQMRSVDGIDLPPHGTVALKPGGYHIMLMGLAQPLKAGESFPITLTFAHAGKVTVTVAVKAAGASGGGDMSMDHMDHDHMDMDHKSNP
jgi:copper(I)-binding protein